MHLFKLIGYDLVFKNLVDKKIIENETVYISKSFNEKKIIPKFLIEKNQNTESLSTLIDGLKLNGDYLEKTILKPNNLNFPISSLFSLIYKIHLI